MAKELNEDTGFNVSIKSLVGIGAAMATVISMWFVLQADIDEAKKLPEPLPPDVTRMEFDMKDQLIRQTIMTTQKDVEELKDDMGRIEEKLDKLIEKGDNMKKFLTIILLSISLNIISQIQVVQFNANWNSANGVTWLNKLTDCGTDQIDIVINKEAQSKYKIIVVPTIVVFNHGEEIKRYQANIMMKMEAKLEDVQNIIDETVMESF